MNSKNSDSDNNQNNSNKNSSNNTSINKIPPYIDGVSALIGSSLATIFLQPFDFLKVRLQGSGFNVNKSLSPTPTTTPTPTRNLSIIGTCKDIIRNEGLKQFWRGSSPTVIAGGIAWGAYMHFYETYKNILKERQGVEQLSTSTHFVCAVAASVSQVFITNPIFLIKTRMQLQKPGSPNYYTGMIDGFKKTISAEGFKGLYKGVIPSLWLTFHGGIQMSLYEHIKYYFSNNSSKSIGATEIFIAGSVSKFLASTVLYPFQVVKTRLQDERNIPNKNNVKVYNGTTDVIIKIFKNEGVYGFYRGLIPNTLKVIPNTSITLLIYEEIKKAYQLYSN